MSFSKALGVLGVAKQIFGGNKKATAPKAEKPPMSPRNKLRCFLAFPALASLIPCILSTLLVTAGLKPGMLEQMSVFTLNTSRIGEGVHDKIDGAIAGINLDDLHIDLKRSAPLLSPASITMPPTTLITMAPRDLKSDLESLTEKAGDNLESANSAVHSKATEVRSKASSAANSVESSVNSGLDSAAQKIKAKLREFVDGAFKDIIAKLNLKGFYSVHMLTTCEGTFTGKDSGKKVDSCEKGSDVNPMKWISIAYWAGVVSGGIALILNVLLVAKPSIKKMTWTIWALTVTAGIMALASFVTHGVAYAAVRLVNFLGEGLSISANQGGTFVSTTWAATFMFATNALVLMFVRRRLEKHPEKLTSKGSSGMIPLVISQPVQQEEHPMRTFHTGRGASDGARHMPSEPAAPYGVRGRDGFLKARTVREEE